jgi:hypothetical protein
VEFACQDDSELSKAATQRGWETLRLTRNSYDLRTKSAIEQVITLLEEKIQAGYAIVLWGSIPCTPWTRWHDINQAKYGPEYEKRLARQRGENLLMVRNYLAVARVVTTSQKYYLAYEWPAHCRGWDSPTMKKVLEELQMIPVRVDGCSVGVQSPDGIPIYKPWTVYTTSPGLREILKTRRCTRDHEHQPCEGQHTERSGFYPAKFCRICIRGFMSDFQVSRAA